MVIDGYKMSINFVFKDVVVPSTTVYVSKFIIKFPLSMNTVFFELPFKIFSIGKE